jgi:hypothetical protein
MNKKRHGQFFTHENPFILDIFREWFAFLPKNAKFLEPFAGANNIVKMIDETFGAQNWTSFDIEPPAENFAKNPVLQKNTLSEMPSGFDAIITNPPYLAKNSATRSGIAWNPENKFDDLYKFSLQKMLEKYNFVAVIIPESFITSGQFREKLFATISLTQTMFSDTEVPVCLAMFIPTELKISRRLNDDDFFVFRMNDLLGRISAIDKKFRETFSRNDLKIQFNDSNGEIGLFGVDNTKKASIRFLDGREIDPRRIKQTSRAITRISISIKLTSNQKKRIIDRANYLLNLYRKETDDILMTSFKGLRADGKYRRRLDYNSAALILNVAIKDCIPELDRSELPILKLAAA